MSVHLRVLVSLVAVVFPLLAFSPSAAAPTGPVGRTGTVVGQVECDWKYGRSCVVGGGMSFM
ncbi:hypothetical protein GKQ77_15855 [Streptomyces sp. BG9H]|uniref:Uncharacterized protein n=1 Tax=Streptomyces anatolicus TaxID=2675858 RepID=A0ABS6YNL7_9ACTN|nr:hypothetical protein [Streptomyces anatolicus]MBW5423023.1 hypothetical protein [Streptomyces anatolicus]